MEKKLKALFDFQKFENNAKLDKIIRESEERYGTALSDDELELASAAGEATMRKEESAENFIG